MHSEQTVPRTHRPPRGLKTPPRVLPAHSSCRCHLPPGSAPQAGPPGLQSRACPSAQRAVQGRGRPSGPQSSEWHPWGPPTHTSAPTVTPKTVPRHYHVCPRGRASQQRSPALRGEARSSQHGSGPASSLALNHSPAYTALPSEAASLQLACERSPGLAAKLTEVIFTQACNPGPATQQTGSKCQILSLHASAHERPAQRANSQ